MTGARRALERRMGLRLAASLIAAFEGGASSDGKFRPYRDPVGVLTQGYGHTAGVKADAPAWSKGKALRVLRHDLAKVYAPPLDRLQLPLRRRMYAAVLSAVYNLGPGILAHGHTLGDELRAHRWRKAADALLLYVNAGGHPLPGLVRRRRTERRMFLRGLHNALRKG